MRKEAIFQIIKAVAATVAAALLYALAFTFIIQLCSLGGAAIKIVNQIFKVVCVALGCLIFIKGEKGLVKGAVAGAVGTTVAYLLFSAIGGAWQFTLLQLAELLVGAIAGGISGIIAVNIKKV